MRMEDVHEVTRLVATRERQHLVDRQVDFVQHKAAVVEPHQGHEPPCRIVSPLDARCLPVISLYHRPNETRLAQADLDTIAGRFQHRAVPRERFRDGFGGIVKEIKVLAEAMRRRREVERRSTGQIAVRSP